MQAGDEDRSDARAVAPLGCQLTTERPRSHRAAKPPRWRCYPRRRTRQQKCSRSDEHRWSAGRARLRRSRGPSGRPESERGGSTRIQDAAKIEISGGVCAETRNEMRTGSRRLSEERGLLEQVVSSGRPGTGIAGGCFQLDTLSTVHRSPVRRGPREPRKRKVSVWRRFEHGSPPSPGGLQRHRGIWWPQVRAPRSSAHGRSRGAPRAPVPSAARIVDLSQRAEDPWFPEEQRILDYATNSVLRKREMPSRTRRRSAYPADASTAGVGFGNVHQN